MDTAVIKDLLKQYGLVSAAIAIIVSFIFNLVGFYVNQQIQSRREERLEHVRADLEKELAEFKSTKVKEAENIQQARWEMKYQACLDAMEIVDAFLSHWFKDVNGITPVRQPADTLRARNCYNKLAMTCERPEVIEAFLRIMFPTNATNVKVTTDNLNTLRNAIRKELGFGNEVKLSQDVAWFVRLAGDNRKDEVDTH